MLNSFTYDSYWHNWDRILKPSNGLFGWVRLTPIGSDTWAPVALIHLQVSDRQEYCPFDKGMESIPEDVVKSMRANLPAPLIQRLLWEDFLSKVDIKLYNKNYNGGCSFHKCMKVG